MPGLHQNQLYSLADPTFYETPARLPDEGSRFALDQEPAPAGWSKGRSGLWTSLRPDGVTVTEQGWKIHVSAVPEDAASTLRETVRICVRHRVPVKFLRSHRALALMSDKYMARGSSGKFVTAYPPDEPAFLRLMTELSDALEGRRGPYVLSDLRIGAGPVHVRYGSFTERWCRATDGTTVPALSTPDGRLVPDERDVVFRVPPWVTVPPELGPHLAARAAARDDGFPYVVDRALQFSDAGGIYLARHRGTGERVVLREARPHSGLDAAGDDAVTRLHREHRALQRLAGLECVPRVHGVRTVWEHHFLVEEYVEGRTLLQEIVARYALVRGERTDAQLDAYRAWADEVTGRLAEALASVHARGLRFGDLHPANVVVRPDGSLVLIDFEYATGLDDPSPFAGAFGMQAPAGTPGAEADAYALWSTWLHMLMPLTEMAGHDRRKALVLERWARDRYRLAPDAGPPRPALLAPAAGTADPVEELLAGPVPDWERLRALLLAGIGAAATPERLDRLFPGGPDGFATGGVCAAHGAAGVLHALRRTGADVPAEWVRWLAEASLRRPPARAGGFLDGLPGAAAVLAALGEGEVAAELLERSAAAPAPVGADLATGRAGTALAALRVARAAGGPEAAPPPAVLRTARDLARLARGETVPGLAAPDSAGLLRGLSGAALLHLELYELTGESWLLAAARDVLHREAAHCVRLPGGSVQVKDGRRHLLYLDQGSGGFALVARAYLEHREDPLLAELLPGVRRGCVLEFVREPGLFTGRAGLTATAHALDTSSAPGETRPPAPDVLASVRNLAWHLVQDDARLLVPGAGLRRFSTDLATGSAGLLLALHTLAGGDGGAASESGPRRLLSLLTLG
ncbi:class III lanthionine synthetase LanKC [Streptomyces sp. TP-A0874]|uniref:class III lanthionine synthetase LanKC n=1 Tax=Streptomyces sp. TP-A0874 TaxID=549819 RepID=UPI000853D043|nr:class III lanthionine synthetase LanKC [Streptomyces sp. TP-A0874]